MATGSRTRLIPVLAGGAALLLVLASTAAAQEPGGAPAAEIDSGATAWILASSALVLFMTPGLALFYAGMVRAKNVLGTMMHSVFCMGLITVQWVLVGYSISFGESSAGGLYGSMKHAFLSGVPHDKAFPGTQIPHMLHMSYQMMFAIITAALISGAFAERIKFSSFAVFTLLWTTLVYDPLAHWVWGGGILSDVAGTWITETMGTGALDFAGGTVVHISSGVSALVFCLIIGKRRGYPTQPMLPNNLVNTTLGAGILWFGWFGFNGGSGLGADGRAVSAFTVTHICAASGALGWAAIEWFHRGKSSILGVATGLVAGLVCITPAAGFVEPMPALFMGLIVSAACYFFVAVLKNKLGYDDSLDAFGVHGVGGVVGALLTGVFCSPLASLGGKTAGWNQLGAQAIAVGVTIAYAGIVTLILVLLIDKTIGMRCSEDDELAGLDLSQHGEAGYNP
ncbi:MAG TPA: ammonium transporter [Planctomycetota bacterium]|nr:ammonium transporter [Planctomycetota bacterium]